MAFSFIVKTDESFAALVGMLQSSTAQSALTGAVWMVESGPVDQWPRPQSCVKHHRYHSTVSWPLLASTFSEGVDEISR